jgi:hypothetical protein
MGRCCNHAMTPSLAAGDGCRGWSVRLHTFQRAKPRAPFKYESAASRTPIVVEAMGLFVEMEAMGLDQLWCLKAEPIYQLPNWFSGEDEGERKIDQFFVHLLWEEGDGGGLREMIWCCHFIYFMGENNGEHALRTWKGTCAQIDTWKH